MRAAYTGPRSANARRFFKGPGQSLRRGNLCSIKLLSNSANVRRYLKHFLLLVILIGNLSFLNGCGASSSPPPPPPAGDFSIVGSPASVSTQVGGTSAPVTVSLNAINGFTGAVSVTVSG